MKLSSMGRLEGYAERDAVLIRGCLLSKRIRSQPLANCSPGQRSYQLSRYNHGALLGYQQAGLERQGNRYLPATIHGKLPHKGGPLRGVSDISCEGALFKWGLQPQIGAIGPAPPSVELFDPKQWQALTKLLPRLRRVFRNSLDANILKITSATFQHGMTL